MSCESCLSAQPIRSPRPFDVAAQLVLLQVSCTHLFMVLAVKLYGKDVITAETVQDFHQREALSATVHFNDAHKTLNASIQAAKDLNRVGRMVNFVSGRTPENDRGGSSTGPSSDKELNATPTAGLEQKCSLMDNDPAKNDKELNATPTPGLEQ